ncbi:MAG: 23S rRNA (adenine(2503)-C(2))-methyltransferase RlmN [Deltaproteobacteria bacterium]|jgi:23S rRNA (adenine2503-C2)-methyltransferase|nr:23S rRNA (adenine(2503)-C(2))-methyltransferase RlmN [Deltaproteobacteria bacterium]
MGKIRLLDLSPPELAKFMGFLGERPFRAKQIAAWLFRKGATSFSEMTDISQRARDLIKERADIAPLLSPLEIVKAPDLTRKILWLAPDGQKFESVLIPQNDHLTLCLSTQVGCQMGCQFCRTGEMGYVRDLSPGEILGQILGVKKLLTAKERLTNLVFMGMGEPLLNLEPVTKSLAIISSPDYLALAGKRISISTVGIVPGIEALGQSSLDFGLTVSLGAPTDELRDQLMPINRKYPLAALKKALAAYPLKRGRRLTIAYILLKGINDGPSEALALSRYLAGLKTKINLIPFNPWPNSPFERPSEETIQKFWRTLYDKGHTVIVRWSKGEEIAGACGQLAGQTSGQIGG